MLQELKKKENIKNSLISEGIFTLVQYSKSVQNNYLQLFNLN